MNLSIINIKEVLSINFSLCQVQKYIIVMFHYILSNLDTRNTPMTTNRDIKNQFYESVRKPQEPFMSDNFGFNHLSNLVSNSHDWKNIQEVVRIAFKYVADSICDQQSQIKYLMSELHTKTNKSELNTKLSSI